MGGGGEGIYANLKRIKGEVCNRVELEFGKKGFKIAKKERVVFL